MHRCRDVICVGLYSEAISNSNVSDIESFKIIRAASWENQQCGFLTSLIQIDLYSHRKELEA